MRVKTYTATKAAIPMYNPHDDMNEVQAPTEEERSEYFLGMDAAMRGAAVKSRTRAIETTGSVPTRRDGKLVYDTEV